VPGTPGERHYPLVNNNYNQTDYLSDLKASNRLIDRIKSYYIERDIPISGFKWWVDRETDQYGMRTYIIRSNMVLNVSRMVTERGAKSEH